MKDIIERHFDEILLLIGVIVSVAILSWMLFAVIDRVNDHNDIQENNKTEEFIANIEACTKADSEDIKDCILLTIDDK